MILADSEIISRINSWSIWVKTNSKYDILTQVWPASLDFRLWKIFKFYKRDSLTLIDPKKAIESNHIETISLSHEKAFILHPGQFVLWATLEKFKIPYDLVARCEWRSSIWRLWVVIHSTAWFIDPGFDWTITLEITNINEIPVALYPDMRIWQLAFETLEWKVAIPYDLRKWSKYMWQSLPEESMIHKDLL